MQVYQEQAVDWTSSQVVQGTYKRVLECGMELRGEHEDTHHNLVLRNKVDWGQALRVTSYVCV